MTCRATSMTSTPRSRSIARDAPNGSGAQGSLDPGTSGVPAISGTPGTSTVPGIPAIPAIPTVPGTPAIPTAPGVGAFEIGDPRDEDVFDHRDFSETDPRDERGVIACWTVRGCHGIWGVTGDYMEEHCPHNIPDRYSPCPATCAYTRCQRPWHQEAVSLEDLLDPDVDRMRTIKEQCRHCLYFIKHGPRAHDSRSSD